MASRSEGATTEIENRLITGDAVVDFGKHKGRTYAEVRGSFPDYSAWVCRTSRSTEECSDELRRLARWLTSGDFSRQVRRPVPAPQAHTSTEANEIEWEESSLVTPQRMYDDGENPLDPTFCTTTARALAALNVAERPDLHAAITSLTEGRLCRTCRPAHWHTGDTLSVSEDIHLPAIATTMHGIMLMAISTEVFHTERGKFALLRTLPDARIVVPHEGAACMQHASVTAPTMEVPNARQRRIARAAFEIFYQRHHRLKNGFIVVEDSAQQGHAYIIIFQVMDMSQQRMRPDENVGDGLLAEPLEDLVEREVAFHDGSPTFLDEAMPRTGGQPVSRAPQRRQ